MNKTSKLTILIVIIVLLSGIVYGVTTILQKFTYNNITLNPTYHSTLDENTINNLWVGTLDLAWKNLQEQLGVNKIELTEKEIPKIVTNLNNSIFSKAMLDENDYEINVERTETQGYKINAVLNKELNFLQEFDNFSNDYRQLTFGNGEEYIKYFGINEATSENVNKNIEVLFYDENNTDSNNSINNFALKLNTKEGDEIILYRTDEKKSFDEYYNDIQIKTEQYDGNRELLEDDQVRIPYIKINGFISYNELFGKEIKNSNGLYISDVTQTVNFNLNEKGCNLSSKATMVTSYLGIYDARYFYFTDTFIVFMKENTSTDPYFALKVDNSNILEKIENDIHPALYDLTLMDDFDSSKIQNSEYKFYEDENYEYYYPTQKSEFVLVDIPTEELMTVEKALKNNFITLDLLDKYEIEYIKKRKIIY